MTQQEVIDVLEKSKVWLSSKQIADIIGTNVRSISSNIRTIWASPVQVKMYHLMRREKRDCNGVTYEWKVS